MMSCSYPPSAPAEGEVKFALHVWGAEGWSWADIENNASVLTPGSNPHNEHMAEIPEDHARELIAKADQAAKDRGDGD